MKIVSFNVNSVRMRMHQLQKLVDTHAPDIIALQETKVQDAEFPIEDIQALGYEVVFHGQKTHYGVATLSKLPIIRSQKGFPGDSDDAQKRFVGITVESPFGGELTVLNGYFPQGESVDHPTKFPNKRAFYADLQQYLKTTASATDQLIVLGDINISPTDLDIGIGEDNRKRWLRSGKCSFQPEERQWLATLEGWGLTDTFRHLNPKIDDLYSWFDYRSKGFDREPKRGLRIDAILATDTLVEKAQSSGIDYEVRAMEKPSDHAPIWTEFL